MLKDGKRTFLVVPWLGICLPGQGTWVWFPVQEDSTCYGATKSVCHDHWARVLQLRKPAHSSVPSPHTAETVLCNERPPPRGDRVPQQTGPRLLQLDRAHAQHRTPRAAGKRWEEYTSPNCGYFKGKEFSRVGSRTDFYCFFFFFGQRL